MDQRHFILDIHHIFQSTYGLARTYKDAVYYIPAPIVEEIKTWEKKQGRTRNTFAKIIEKASNRNYVNILRIPDEKWENYMGSAIANKHISRGISLIAGAWILKRKNITAEIITADPQLIDLSRSLNIICHTPEEYKILSRKMLPFVSSDHNLENEITKTIFADNWQLITKAILGLIFASLAVLIYWGLPYILTSVHIGIVITAFVVLGFILFVFREWNKVGYGLAELIVGIFSLFVIFPEATTNYYLASVKLGISFKLLGSLYIMVRGLDNMVKGLKNTRLGTILKERFRMGL